MALRNNNIAINVDVNASKAAKELGGLKGSLGGISTGAAGATIALAALTAGFVAASSKALAHASKLELIQNKSATVFGEQLPMIQRWSSETASAFGMTAVNLEGMAAGFADLLIPMQFTRAEAADMTQKVVGLAGAMSEWSAGTRTVEDTTRILARAMLGEREMLKDLGVDIRELDIKQRLMAKGQEDLTGNFLKQARAVATMEMIFERSKDAQAGFETGSDSLTRQTRIMNAAFQEMVQEIVIELTPTFKEVIGVMNKDLVPALKDIIPFILDVVSAFGKVVGAAAKAGGAIVDFAHTTTEIANQSKSFGEATGFNTMKIREFRAAGIDYIEAMKQMGIQMLKGKFHIDDYRDSLVRVKKGWEETAAATLAMDLPEIDKNFIRVKERAEAAAIAVDEVAFSFKALTAEQLATKLATDLVLSGIDMTSPLFENMIQESIALLKTLAGPEGQIQELKEQLLFGAGARVAKRTDPKTGGSEGPINNPFVYDDRMVADVIKAQKLSADQIIQDEIARGFLRFQFDFDKMFGGEGMGSGVFRITTKAANTLTEDLHGVLEGNTIGDAITRTFHQIVEQFGLGEKARAALAENFEAQAKQQDILFGDMGAAVHANQPGAGSQGFFASGPDQTRPDQSNPGIPRYTPMSAPTTVIIQGGVVPDMQEAGNLVAEALVQSDAYKSGAITLGG
jgi:hypothetical protein